MTNLIVHKFDCSLCEGIYMTNLIVDYVKEFT